MTTKTVWILEVKLRRNQITIMIQNNFVSMNLERLNLRILLRVCFYEKFFLTLVKINN